MCGDTEKVELTKKTFVERVRVILQYEIILL